MGQKIYLREKSLKRLLLKKDDLNMRVTTKISGKTKERFLEDCEKKEGVECETAKSILDIHYAIIDFVPNHAFMEFSAIKKYLIEKIKLK